MSLFLLQNRLEKLSITSLAHQWILCSEWVPPEIKSVWTHLFWWRNKLICILDWVHFQLNQILCNCSFKWKEVIQYWSTHHGSKTSYSLSKQTDTKVQGSRKTHLTFTKIIIVYIHEYQRQENSKLRGKRLLSHISHCFGNSKDFVNVVVKDCGEVRTRILPHDSAKWHFSSILAILHVPDLRHAATGPGDEEETCEIKDLIKQQYSF